MLSLLLLAVSSNNESESELPGGFISEGLAKAKEDATKELQTDLTITYVDVYNNVVEAAATRRAAIKQYEQFIAQEQRVLAELDRTLSYMEANDGTCASIVRHLAPAALIYGGSASQEFRTSIRYVFPNVWDRLIPETWKTPEGFKGAARRIKLAVPKRTT